MSIRGFCILLIFSCLAKMFGSDIIINNVTSILKNDDACAFKLNFEKLPTNCKKLVFPAEGRYGFVVQASGEAVLSSMPSLSESDELELLCYRCALKKEKEKCGRYIRIWNKPDAASKCPSMD